MSGWRTERRLRRAAAQLVFAELTVGFAAARTALASEGGEWPTLRGPDRTMWETHGRHLLTERGVAEVGRLAHAYSALDDAAWLASKGHGDPEAIQWVASAVASGMLALADLAGLDREEMERRLAVSREMNEKFVEEMREMRDQKDAGTEPDSSL